MATEKQKVVFVYRDGTVTMHETTSAEGALAAGMREARRGKQLLYMVGEGADGKPLAYAPMWQFLNASHWTARKTEALPSA